MLFIDITNKSANLKPKHNPEIKNPWAIQKTINNMFMA